LDTATREVVAAEARLEGASAHVTVDATAPTTVVVDGAATTLAGGSGSWTASVPLTVEVPGQVRVTVAPAATAAELLAAAGAARHALHVACDELGVADLDEARAVHAERTATASDHEAAVALVARILGASTPADLDAEIAQAEQRAAGTDRSTAPAEHTADLADLDAGQVAERLHATRRRRDEARVALDDLDADVHHHRERAERATLDDAALAARIEQVEAHRRRADERLAAARAVVPDAVVDQALVDARSALEA